MNDHAFLSTYKKDYVKKPIKFALQKPLQQEFKDPIGIAHKPYLFLKGKELEKPEEDGLVFLDRFKAKQDVRQIYFEEPLDTELILRRKARKELNSEYRENFCDMEQELLLYQEGNKQSVRLSNDIQIPLTTQASSYRDPMIYSSMPPLRVPQIVPPDNLYLTGTKSVNKMLNPKLEISEYTYQICKLGELICKTNLDKYLSAR